MLSAKHYRPTFAVLHDQDEIDIIYKNNINIKTNMIHTVHVLS